jgi:choline dehydrogenase-like flavoprotein
VAATGAETMAFINRDDPGADPDINDIHQRTIESNYHRVGTRRMGLKDHPMLVLTPDLKVRSVGALRVFDGS